MKTTSDFSFPTMDKLMGAFQAPKFDAERLMAAHRRNLETITTVNKLAAESFQAMAKRQGEIMRQSVTEMTESMRDVFAEPTQANRGARQTEIAKKAVESAISNTRELAEMSTKANTEMFTILSQRVVEGFDELKALSKV